MGSLLLILSIVIIKFPPSKINSSYGSRTNLSMRNIDTWKEGNQKFAQYLFIGSLILIAQKIIIIIINPSNKAAFTILFIISLLLVPILSLIFTNVYLKTIFDSEGNRKNN
ncbi:SdpI family protein [Mucilaginibacter sp. L196]|uniref:SdpI family protein n=1 Tax=Mucilaginibacter sp. L196 TaxID=1641870 RepID=UPI00352FECA6